MAKRSDISVSELKGTRTF